MSANDVFYGMAHTGFWYLATPYSAHPEGVFVAEGKALDAAAHVA